MTYKHFGKVATFLFSVLFLLSYTTEAQSKKVLSLYNIYRGSTHAHTSYTWSHGEQWAKTDCKGIVVFGGDFNADSVDTWKAGYVNDTVCPAIIIVRSSQYPGPGLKLKQNWREVQGLPSVHFALAKANGYDFYISTDHSQEYAFNPPASSNQSWIDTKQAAETATDDNFIAIRGYEHSENNGPNGQGHLNVINSSEYLNALDPQVDLPYLYKWLKTVKPTGEGPVVATFNHPGAKQYNNWAYRDAEITDIITMLEVINSNNKIHYEAFVNALDKGWKVSPVCGNDNHGLTGIMNNTSRTFVLAKSKTKKDILEAMKNRRTYASLDQDIQCSYTLNDSIMGSTLPAANAYKFNIEISDPGTNEPKNKITQIDIVSDSGKVLKTYKPGASYSVSWSPTIQNVGAKYFFVRVWNAGGGDAKAADQKSPVAWLAPVWIKK